MGFLHFCQAEGAKTSISLEKSRHLSSKPSFSRGNLGELTYTKIRAQDGLGWALTCIARRSDDGADYDYDEEDYDESLVAVVCRSRLSNYFINMLLN